MNKRFIRKIHGNGKEETQRERKNTEKKKERTWRMSKKEERTESEKRRNSDNDTQNGKKAGNTGRQLIKKRKTEKGKGVLYIRHPRLTA